jgi:hypothetical protein
MLSFLTLALVPAVARLRPAGLTAFLACVAFAIFVQAVGAFCFPKGGSYLLSKSDFWKPSRANNGILPLGPGATLEVSCRQNSGGVHLLLDVNGYFE